MKKAMLACAPLLFCAGLLLTGCAGGADAPKESAPAPTQSPAPMQETDSPVPPTPPPAESSESLLARIEEQEDGSALYFFRGSPAQIQFYFRRFAAGEAEVLRPEKLRQSQTGKRVGCLKTDYGGRPNDPEDKTV